MHVDQHGSILVLSLNHLLKPLLGQWLCRFKTPDTQIKLYNTQQSITRREVLEGILMAQFQFIQVWPWKQVPATPQVFLNSRFAFSFCIDRNRSTLSEVLVQVPNEVLAIAHSLVSKRKIQGYANFHNYLGKGILTGWLTIFCISQSEGQILGAHLSWTAPMDGIVILRNLSHQFSFTLLRKGPSRPFIKKT